LLANLVHSFRDDLVQMGPSPLKKEAGQLSQVQLTR